jgi:[acyl-carrier-protein] S-malonyltransferase
MTSFAFVFPGQGSQAVGMLDAWGDHPAVAQTLAEASAALGEDIGRLIHDGPKEELALTTNTQPVMLTAGIACWRAWRAEGGAEPIAVAGHSLGEYTALVAAGALTLADALPLVRLRATAMQEAVPVGVGAMAAILGLDAEAVRTTCVAAAQASGEVVEAVNFNDPKQTVIAGTKAGVDKACEMLKAAGAKRALPLPVSAPFHSSLMKPAALRLQAALEQVALAAPKIPVVNNIDVASPTESVAIRDALVRQAAGPVRWVEVVQALKARGATHVIECGRVRSGDTRRSERVARMSIDSVQTALVTGATRGIGRAIALELARRGFRVIGTATSDSGAQAITDALAGHSGCRGVKLDVNDSAGVSALVDALVKEYGGLHVLVNNAGITRDGLTVRMKDDDWDAVADTNLKSVFRLSREVVRPMMKQRFGRIVNITSVVGSIGNGGQANYAAAKAGVAGLTRSMAQELGSRGITVNCVAPGFIETDMTEVLPEAQKTALLEKIPVNRLGKPEEIAKAVAFLVSADAAYITGTELHVNGGMYMN